MDPAHAAALRSLLETQEIAALGTLHEGEPFVSMVPVALLPRGAGFVIHVSRLAQHTKDMLASPAVSLLIVAPRTPEVTAQARARATVQGEARQCAGGDSGHEAAKRAYLGKFPQSEQMFGFADFSLFVIVPRTVRFIGGFAQARSITAETLADIMSASP
jgi:heme oxygenase (biliverdin-IX-beta and delta-forming)